MDGQYRRIFRDQAFQRIHKWSLIDRGIKHVLWLDALGGFMYASGSGNERSRLRKPLNCHLPLVIFYPDLRSEDETPLFKPVLVADKGGLIHAFWVDEGMTLLHSSVAAGEFTTFSSWSRRDTIDEGVLDVAGTADDGNFVHVAYLRDSDEKDRPTGVYYRRLAPDGNWLDPQLIDESRYIRAVPEEERHIQIIAPGGRTFTWFGMTPWWSK